MSTTCVWWCWSVGSALVMDGYPSAFIVHDGELVIFSNLGGCCGAILCMYPWG